MNINEITYKEIKDLNDVNLSKLLLKLLNEESQKYRFAGLTEIIVPLRINVGDAGEDGRITCTNTNGSMYVTNPQSIYQNKATDISPSDIYKEFFSVNKPAVPAKKGKAAQSCQLVLKEKIKEVLDLGGQYVFFIGHDYNAKLVASRLVSAQNALFDYNALHRTTYQPSQIRIIEANEIANWTNNFIGAVTFVQAENGIKRPDGLQILGELESYEEFRKIPFQSNDTLDNFIVEIQATMAETNSSLRIIGHSGLGKTRLVYEAFKSSKILSQAVYYNIDKNSDAIIQFVRTYGRRLEGILVVDNCDHGAHKLLKDEIRRTDSKFKLVTIDYNVFEESEPSKTLGEKYIFLHSRFYKEIVKDILKQQFNGRLNSSSIDQIAAFSEGYPSMAVLFANARIDGHDNLTEILDDDVIERLAFGRDYGNKDHEKFKEKFEVLIACSIFSRIGRPASHLKLILTEQEKSYFNGQMELIRQKICDPVKSPRQFLESIDYFEDRKVLERRGYNLSVRPTPLALKLAMKWWKYFEKNQLLELFPLLEQNQLAIPLVERLSELDQLREAQQIMNDLWGSKSPFGSAEVLNTALGSRLFRSIAQVNPETAITTLEAAFGSMTLTELKETVGPGRRYLVWTLEMLVFRKDTFERAISLLFRFAAAENENISNNATGQLLHLFQTILAGTEVNLPTRLLVIDNHLNSSEIEIKHLAVLAMIRGLKGDSFTRTIGAENQGTSAPLIDYRPSWPETANYSSGIIERLIEVARNRPEERHLVKQGIARAFRNLFRENLSHLVKLAILKICDFDPSYWEDAINQLKASEKYETVNDEENELINNLLLHLQPKTLEDRIKSFVSVPEWNLDKDDKGRYVDHGANNAEDFAERLIAEKVDLTSILPLLVRGEQRKGFVFGRKLGELLQDSELADNTLEMLSTMPVNDRNVEFAAGYISALADVKRKTIMKSIMESDQLVQYAVYFIKFQFFELENISQLLELVDKGSLKIDQFSQLSFGVGFMQISNEDFLTLVEMITKRTNGEYVALELIQYFIHDNNERWKSFRPFLRKLIIGNNLLLNIRQGNLEYLWYQTIEKLLEEEIDKELIRSLSEQLLETAEKDRLSYFDNSLKKVFQIVIEKDYKLFWNIIGPGILNNTTYFNFKFFLGTDNGIYGNPGLLQYTNYDLLVDWCEANSPLAPKRIAYMMPITVKGDKAEWHPLALKMIGKFGELDGFMNELSANVHSFGSVGSAIPYLKNQQQLFAALKDHHLQKVRTWARKEVSDYTIKIEREGLEEQSEYW